MSTDPVEDYLDELLPRLPGSPREVRLALAEVDAHLHALVDDGVASGLTLEQAGVEAVRRMGPAAGVADTPHLLPRLTRPLRRRLVLAVLRLAAVAGVAAGVAGLIAAAARALWGDRAIGEPFPSGSYSASDCARWLAEYPHAGSCAVAMTADHAADFLRNTAAAAVLGVLALIAYRMLRRRWGAVTGRRAAADYLVGAACAAITALVAGGAGVNAVLVTHGVASWAPFSLALAAVGAGAWFVAAGRREVARAPVAVAG